MTKTRVDDSPETRRKGLRVTKASTHVEGAASVADLSATEKRVLRLLDAAQRVDGRGRRHVSVAAQGLKDGHARVLGRVLHCARAGRRSCYVL